MKFITSAAALLGFIGSAFSQSATPGFNAITSPTNNQVLTSGQTYQITWQPTASYNGQKVSILLLQGSSQATLQIGPTIASGIDSGAGSYSWTPSASGYPQYGLKLQLDSNTTIFQYSFPFTIAAGTTTTSAVIPLATSASSNTTLPKTNVPYSNTTQPGSPTSGGGSPQGPGGKPTDTPTGTKIPSPPIATAGAAKVAAGALAAVGGVLAAVLVL